MPKCNIIYSVNSKSPCHAGKKASVPVPSHISSKEPHHSHGLLHPPYQCFLLILTITISPSYCQEFIFVLVITYNSNNFPASHTKSDFFGSSSTTKLVSAGDQAPHHLIPEKPLFLQSSGNTKEAIQGKI